MTRGRLGLTGDESVYDVSPVVLFETFRWSERQAVAGNISRILAVQSGEWVFGGAYLFCRHVPQAGVSEVLYIGESRDLATRLRTHLTGPPAAGNKNKFLAKEFRQDETACEVALLVVPPDKLPVLDTPDGPDFEGDVEKRAAERIESILLRAHFNWRNCLPRGNTRADLARAAHSAEGAKLIHLVRFLCDDPDGWCDFVSFRIGDETEQASQRLQRHIDECPVILARRQQAGP